MKDREQGLIARPYTVIGSIEESTRANGGLSKAKRSLIHSVRYVLREKLGLMKELKV